MNKLNSCTAANKAMKMNIQVTSKIQIILGLIVGMTASFLRAPSDQFQSTFNSTFLSEYGKLNGPIVIPNVTEVSETYASKPNVQNIKNKENAILKNTLETELSRGSSSEKTTLKEDFKPSENRFSSRYSSEEATVRESNDGEEEEEEEEKVTSITDIPRLLERGEPISSQISLPSPPKANSFSDRSDTGDDGEEKKTDRHRYPDSSEANEREESEITFTTNEPYSELRTPSSILTSPDEDFENYETASGVADKSDESEKEDNSEAKRSLDDYHDSGSKNYHSIQTPLSKIKYKNPNRFRSEFDGKNTKESTPKRLRLIKHNWPYIKGQLKTELEENEISDEEENQKLESDEWGIREDLKTPQSNAKAEDLEQAIRKDEIRFNRTGTHNYIDDRIRRKQQAKNLAKEEEKDRKNSYYKAPKQYSADGDEPKHFPVAKFARVLKQKHFEKSSAVPLGKKPKNIFFNYHPATATKSTIPNNSKELTLDFPVHQFLGSAVLNKDNSKIQTTNLYPKTTKAFNVPYPEYVKNLEQKEKLDQNKILDQKFQKTIFVDKDANYKSFNHLEESNEMYNAILANIQSVFGLRTQSLRAGNAGNNHPEVNFEERSALTWSVPLIKRQTKPHEGVLESVTLERSDGKVKSGSEGEPALKKSIFPTDTTQS